jgi:hypothetical protein
LQGISLHDIKNAIEEGKINNSFNKLDQQGFNIKQISESDYNAVLSLDNDLYPSSRKHVDNNKKLTFVAKWSRQGEEKRILIVPIEHHAAIEKMKNPLKVTVEEIVE